MADATRGRISAIPAGTGHCVLPLCPTTVSTTSTIPTGKGYDGDYRPLCPNAVPMIGRPLKASALYTGASAILGFVPAETPPTAVPASAPTKSRPRAQSVHSGLHVRRRVHSEAFPGLPRRTGSDGTTTPPQYSKDGPLRRPRHHRDRPQGSDVPPLLARRRIVIHVRSLSSLQL